MSTSGRPPNYYAILDIPETATSTQIRDAYKRAALKTHPDRVPVDSPERVARTRKFQLVNDAYFTLSDPGRRREYDAQRKLFGGDRSAGAGFGAPSPNMPGGFDTDADDTDNTTNNNAAGGAYSWAWNFFTGQNTNANANNAAGAGTGNNREQQRAQTEDAQFADVFEEMLREEGLAEPATGRPTGKFWALLGGLSGGALGFIVANVPGLLAGAVAGNRLGAVRDAKGKSVYAVFQDLPQDDRAKLLSQLAARVFSHAVGI